MPSERIRVAVRTLCLSIRRVLRPKSCPYKFKGRDGDEETLRGGLHLNAISKPAYISVCTYAGETVSQGVGCMSCGSDRVEQTWRHPNENGGADLGPRQEVCGFAPLNQRGFKGVNSASFNSALGYRCRSQSTLRDPGRWQDMQPGRH